MRIFSALNSRVKTRLTFPVNCGMIILSGKCSVNQFIEGRIYAYHWRVIMRKKAFILCGIIGAALVLTGILFTLSSVSIGIIGGADGPTKVFL